MDSIFNVPSDCLLHMYRMRLAGKSVLGFIEFTDIHDNRSYARFSTLENANFLIPAGVYNVCRTFSPNFSNHQPYRGVQKGLVPLIYNNQCPASRGIRIHVGNHFYDSAGCILIGSSSIYLESLEEFCLVNSADAYITFSGILAHVNSPSLILEDLWLENNPVPSIQ